jgi:ribosomal protein S12 methylthiotransferase
MKRPASSENNLARIRHWREICPDITLRSTFIVGFPGETEADFEQLLEFLAEAELDRVGCFAYSPVSGAAANSLSGEIPEEVKQERRERFMTMQESISATKLIKKIGKRMTVLVDDVHDKQAVARSSADAPEIDGLVYITNVEKAKPGDLLEVEITGSDEHDLYAKATSQRG